MANLVLAMFKSDGTRRDFPLVKDRVVIGRKVNCDLRIPLTSVSRQHCELTITDGKVQVKDLGSSNGTYHNSIRVQDAHLSAGDELVVGPVVFTLVVDGQPAEIKPVRTIVGGEGSGLQPSAKQANGGAAASVTVEAEDDLELPELIDAGAESSQVIDLDADADADEDPIAALEALSNENDDSDEFDDIDFFDIDDDDDKK